MPGAFWNTTATSGSTTVGGTLAPGHSIGTMTIDGDLTFGADSVYEVEVSPRAADRTNVTGLATLNGTVRIIAEPGDYTPEVLYTILSAGSLSGTFTGFTSDFASYTFIAPDADLRCEQCLFLARAHRDVCERRRDTEPGRDRRRRGFARLRQSARPERPLRHRRSGSRRLRCAFGRDSCERGQRDRRRDALPARCGVRAFARHLCVERPSSAWVQPVGARGELEGDGNAASLSRSTAGLFAGLDTTIGAKWRLGAAGGYTQSWFDADERASSGSSENVHLAAYGSGQFGALSLRLGFARAWQQLETSRDVSYSGFDDQASAGYSANTTQLFGELGYGIALGRSSLEPFAGLSYVNIDTGDFREDGGDAALTGSSVFETSIATLGVRGSVPLMTGDRIQLALRGGLGWRHASATSRLKRQLGFVAGGVPFAVRGAPIARDALGVQAGIDIDMGPKAKLSVLYDGQLAAGASDNGARLNLSLRF